MRIEGRWHRGADGVERPVLDGQITVPGGYQLALSLLIDTGADSTVLAPDVAQRLADVTQPTPTSATAVGIGGAMPIYVSGRSRFIMHSRRPLAQQRPARPLQCVDRGDRLLVRHAAGVDEFQLLYQLVEE